MNRALSDLYVGAVATVQIDEYTDNQVTVLGHVSNPGVQHFSEDPTLLDALARAGVPSSQAGTDSGRRSESFTRCAIFRGNDSVIWIDLRPLLRGDGLALNIRLHRDDLIYVPDSNDNLVYVMGQVSKPGAYELSSNMSFLDALAMAGGPNDNAQPGKIVLARPSQNLSAGDRPQAVHQGRRRRQLRAGAGRHHVCAQERHRVARLRAAADKSAHAGGIVRSRVILMSAALPLSIQPRAPDSHEGQHATRCATR